MYAYFLCVSVVTLRLADLPFNDCCHRTVNKDLPFFAFCCNGLSDYLLSTVSIPCCHLAVPCLEQITSSVLASSSHLSRVSQGVLHLQHTPSTVRLRDLSNRRLLAVLPLGS